MKINIILIIAVLAVNLNLALANNASDTYFDNPVEMNLNRLTDPAPVTPQEATFEDDMTIYTPACLVCDLKFTTPKEAYFNDIVPEPLVDITTFAPVTPKEASFDDEMNCGAVLCNDRLKDLAPITPKKAGFNSSSMNFGIDMDNLSPEYDKETGD